MRRALVGVWMLAQLWLAATGWTVLDEGSDRSQWGPESGLPGAEVLLDKLQASFPAVPVALSGELWVQNQSGEIERRIHVEVFLNWNASEPEARYTICDAFGSPLEELYVQWHGDGRRTCRYRAGDPLKTAELPDLAALVQGTDVSWLDLSLAYLRWRGGKTVGSESVRGRFCYIVDVPAPREDAAHYAGARLWIDPQIGILLQAVAYDHEGKPAKLLEVKSFKKIRDLWVIKDIDVQSFPVGHRTRLRILKAESSEAAASGESKRASRDTERSS